MLRGALCLSSAAVKYFPPGLRHLSLRQTPLKSIMELSFDHTGSLAEDDKEHNMAHDNFTVKFWGVRGSHPAPGPQTVHYGGNTACVEVRVGGHVVILDAGTGIIPLGRELAAHNRQLQGGGVQPLLILF